MQTKPHCSLLFGLNYPPAKSRGGWGRGGKKKEHRYPHPRQFGPALPHPHSWGGGRAGERATGAGPPRGGVVVPGGRKRRKGSCFPFRPPPPRPPPQAPGAQQTGWRWGQGRQGQSAGPGPGSARPARGWGSAPGRTRQAWGKPWAGRPENTKKAAVNTSSCKVWSG